MTETEINETEKVFAERSKGVNTGWKSFVKAGEQEVNVLMQQIGLNPEQKLITLFTSSDDEAGVSKAWKPVIIDQFEWIRRTIHFFKDKPEYLKVYERDGAKKYPMVLNDLAFIKFIFMEYDKALSFIKKYEAVILNDDIIDSGMAEDLYFLKGKILLELHNLEEAKASFYYLLKNSAEGYDFGFEYYFYLARIEFLQGDYSNSLQYIKEFEEKIGINKGFDDFKTLIEILRAKLITYYYLDDTSQVETLLNNALRELYEIENIFNKETDELADAVFDILLKKGDFETAEKVLEQRKKYYSFYGGDIDLEYMYKNTFMFLNQGILYDKAGNPKALESFLILKERIKELYELINEEFDLHISTFEEFWETDILDSVFSYSDSTDFYLNITIPKDITITDFIDKTIERLKKAEKN